MIRPQQETSRSIIEPSWTAESAGRNASAPVDAGFNPAKLLRLAKRYWLLLLVCLLMGGIGGVVSLIYSTPVYQTQLMLEVQPPLNEMWQRGNLEAAETNGGVNLQTQIRLLNTGPYVRRVLNRLQVETIPTEPTRTGTIAKLRERFHPAAKDPTERMQQGLRMAAATFQATPINGTRLIELRCESSSPEMASQFLNALAANYVGDMIKGRNTSSQRANDWLSTQLDETRKKLQDAQTRLNEFARGSGITSTETTLDDSKLAQLKSDLARMQAERITKQTRYEQVSKTPADSLPILLNSVVLLGYQRQMGELKREKAILETTYTQNHAKVQKLDAQLTMLEAAFQKETAVALEQAKSEYEASLRQEKLLANAYNAQAGRSSAMVGSSSTYQELKRDVEMIRQSYQALMTQANQTSLSSSLPVEPIRLVEPSSPPPFPYKPNSTTNVLMGVIFGLLAAGGIVFLREFTDRSVKDRGTTQMLMMIPELGAIPSANTKPGARRLAPPVVFQQPESNALVVAAAKPVLPWDNSEVSLIAESFRQVVASLLRARSPRSSTVLMVTSAAPKEGKTSVASHLAITLAETGRRVVVVDGDFRRPRLHKVFSTSNEWGLIDLITDSTPVEDYPETKLFLPTAIEGLQVVPNRFTEHNLSAALHSSRLPALLSRLRRQFDTVILDAPPVLYLADARLLGLMTDGVILVVRAGVTHEKAAIEAYETLHRDGLTVVGTILNDWKMEPSEMKQYYYYCHNVDEKTGANSI